MEKLYFSSETFKKFLIRNLSYYHIITFCRSTVMFQHFNQDKWVKDEIFGMAVLTFPCNGFSHYLVHLPRVIPMFPLFLDRCLIPYSKLYFTYILWNFKPFTVIHFLCTSSSWCRLDLSCRIVLTLQSPPRQVTAWAPHQPLKNNCYYIMIFI